MAGQPFRLLRQQTPENIGAARATPMIKRTGRAG
jgi:hypothetical protein